MASLRKSFSLCISFFAGLALLIPLDALAGSGIPRRGPVRPTSAERAQKPLRQRLDEMRAKASHHQSEAKRLQDEIKRLVSSCKHDWCAAEYKPDHQEGYRIPSDREQGIELGVDSRPAMYVPPKTTRRWSRTCPLCGLIQTTTRTKKQKAAGQVPGTTAEVEVPDFGD